MTLILKGLYLGGIIDLTPLFLYDHHIKTIINVAKECKSFHDDYVDRKDMEVFYYPIEDTNMDISNEMRFITDLIHTQLEKGNVLIHCRAGISRSASIVLAYLVIKYHYTLHDAYEYTRGLRAILPNPYFMIQLIHLERQILQINSFKDLLEDYFVNFIMRSLNLPKSRLKEVKRLFLIHDKDIWTTVSNIHRRIPPKSQSAHL